jgi:hypothetical protein
VRNVKYYLGEKGISFLAFFRLRGMRVGGLRIVVEEIDL